MSQRRSRKCCNWFAKWSCLFKTMGIWLMGLGALLIVIFVPLWVWPAILGLAVFLVGFLLWKFS